jgi:hypothetical protein
MERFNQALNKFGKGVVKQSRANLTRQKKNVDKTLYNSLDYKVQTAKSSFSIKFYMEDYGNFQDLGVKGTKSNYRENSNSPYSYRSKRPPVKPLADWAKKRRIRLRDSKGKFKRGNYKSIGFLISRSIFEKGIRSSKFFTRAFETQYKRLPDELIEIYSLELTDLLKFSR